MKLIGVSLFLAACADAATSPPPDHHHPILLDFTSLPIDLQDWISDLVDEARDFRSLQLALSKDPVPSKETNDNLLAIVGPPSLRKGAGYRAMRMMQRSNLDLGVIPTSQSSHIGRYKSIEGKINPRTYKPFKFDAVYLQEGWQEDPVWQAWNWSNVRQIEFTYGLKVDLNRADSPLTRLYSLKTLDLRGIFDSRSFEKTLRFLKLSRRTLESVKLYMPPKSHQVVQAICALDNLKSLVVNPNPDFAAEFPECLLKQNALEELEFMGVDVTSGFAASREMLQKLHLKRFVCNRCQAQWTEQLNLEWLLWGFGGDHANNVKALRNILKMKYLNYLKLSQPFTKLSQEEFEVIRQISIGVVEKMEIVYRLHDNETLKELPGFTRSGRTFSRTNLIAYRPRISRKPKFV